MDKNIFAFISVLLEVALKGRGLEFISVLLEVALKGRGLDT